MADKSIVIFVAFLFTCVKSQITSSPVAQTVCVGDNVDLDWVYDNTANFAAATWSHIDSSLTSKTIMQLSLGGTPTIIGNFNVMHKSNGGITLTDVSKENAGSYKITVNYLSGSPVDDTVSVTVNDCSSCKCECERCKARVWICISFSCVGIIPEGIFLVGLVCASFSRTKLMVFAFIVIVFEIIGCGVSISVPAEKCCTECCENWYEPSSITFIVISCIVAAAGLVELGLVFKNIIGPGRNAYKAKEAKEPGENHGMTGTSM